MVELMALPLARTNGEAHLYMEMNPCPDCGEGDFDPGNSVVLVDGDLVSRYAGPCPGCGAMREFLFRIPQNVIIPDEEEPVFGDEHPSELLDPGEWVWLADLIAGQVPAEPDGLSPDERRQMRIDLKAAAAAMSEALKFLPYPMDALPPQAMWTERGRAVYEEDPGRFRRGRLEAVERTYRELAERFS
jgi:hypothetical protein